MSYLARMEITPPQLPKSDFLNPDVLDAVNPHPVWGYAHGPIPDNNPDWRLEGLKYGLSTVCQLKVAHTSHTSHRPQAPMVTMNRCNTSVCDILVQDTHMRGANFSMSVRWTRHLYQYHPGAANLLDANHLAIEEMTVGMNAIKRWVLMGGWRNALYLSEPGQASSTTLIGYYCDMLEKISHTDGQFAAEYGTPSNRSGPRKQYRAPKHHKSYIATIRPITLAIPSKSGGDDSGKPSRHDQATQTEPISDNGHDVNSGFTSGSGPDCYIVSNSISKVDSEPEDKEDWPMDAVTDIFAGLYLPSSKLDAAYGPMSEEVD